MRIITDDTCVVSTPADDDVPEWLARNFEAIKGWVTEQEPLYCFECGKPLALSDYMEQHPEVAGQSYAVVLCADCTGTEAINKVRILGSATSKSRKAVR